MKAPKVQIWVSDGQQPGKPRRKTAILTVATLMGAIALVVGGGWLAVRLILNPGSMRWLGWILPAWNELPFMRPSSQTLAEIEAEVTQAGLALGKPIYLSTYSGLSQESIGFHDFLLPIVSRQPRCSSASAACGSIVELRLYHPQSRPGTALAYELVDQMSVTGPEELTAIAPLMRSSAMGSGSTRLLPLTAVSFISGAAPADGVWVQLSGQWRRGSSQVVYGQVVRYDLLRNQLQPLLRWTSPAGQLPQWQQVTGSPAAELVVNQTVGLEPQFQVYQVRSQPQPGFPIQLEAIALTTPAIEDRTYEHSLLLARNGLWSLALRRLQAFKQTDTWSPMAQAQLDVIALHAAITQAQADRDWASPTQQMLAHLIDGRWSKALQLLQAAHSGGYDISNLLTASAALLQKRVETALRISPNQLDLWRWGVLMRAAQENREAAIAWLQRQPAAQIGQVQPILALLDPLPAQSAPTVAAASPAAQPAQAAVPQPDAPPHPAQLIGTAVPLAQIAPADWLNPEPASPLTLAANQSWYQVTVGEFFDGQRWQHPGDRALENLLAVPGNSSNPSGQIAQALWKQLGLTHNAQIQLLPNPASDPSRLLQTTAKAVQIKAGELRLLVAVPLAPASLVSAAAPRLLATTLSTLPWLEPPDRLSLAALNQQPLWSTQAVPALWQTLQQGNMLPPSIDSPDALAHQFGDWSIGLIDLTGDRQPEAVLTLQINSPRAAALPSSDTLIFSAQGQMIYNDLGQPKSLIAIANRADGRPPALVVSDGQTYQLEQWSAEQQQFE